MEVRPFQLKDSDEVIALWKRCNLVVPANDPVKDIQRKLKVDPDLFLVGLHDGKVVASVMGGYDGHRGWLNYVAVCPDHRRKGFGRIIMEEIEKKIREKGGAKINLQVRKSNLDVIAFYNALGFAMDDVVGMGKRLEFD